MNKYKLFFSILLFLLVGLYIGITPVNAQCKLSDPGDGEILIPQSCRNAHLEISGSGSRYLPLPEEVPHVKKLWIKWDEEWNRNTTVISWDEEMQASRFYIYDGTGSWEYNPENAVMYSRRYPYEIPTPRPEALMQSKYMPNGEWGWAVYYMRDLEIWNGGN